MGNMQKLNTLDALDMVSATRFQHSSQTLHAVFIVDERAARSFRLSYGRHNPKTSYTARCTVLSTRLPQLSTTGTS